MCGLCFDVEMYCQMSVSDYKGRRISTADLARIIAGAPRRYQKRVAERVVELHSGI